MINALGLLEVEGMVAAVDAADAMLKAANVNLLSHEVLDPGKVTLVVEGDLAACRAALDAGSAAAQRTGRVISRKEIGRPDDDTQWLIGGFKRASTPLSRRKRHSLKRLRGLNTPTRCWRSSRQCVRE